MSMLQKRNNALDLNNGQNGVDNSVADIAITTHGSDWYFTVCAVMTVSMFAFIGLALRKPRTDRIFHYITTGVVMVAAVAYFTMGSHLGYTAINVEFHRNGGGVGGNDREIYYARYIDWVITTPLLLLDLLLTAALPWPTIAMTVLVDEVMIVTGLIGALVASRYKWGYYVFGCLALFYILYVLVWEGRKHANAMGRDVGRAFLICGSMTAFLWCLYPIAWGVSEGGNVITPDSEAVFYGILDLLAKPVFGALLIWGHRNISPAQLGIAIHDYGANEQVVNEKKKHMGEEHNGNGTTNGTNGVTNGTDNHAPHANIGHENTSNAV